MPKVLNVTMPEDLFEAVDRQAKIEDRSRSSIFREALRLYLALQEPGKRRMAKRASRQPMEEAEQVLRNNVVALNRLAMARGLSEEDILHIAGEVREEVYQERYGAKS